MNEAFCAFVPRPALSRLSGPGLERREEVTRRYCEARHPGILTPRPATFSSLPANPASPSSASGAPPAACRSNRCRGLEQSLDLRVAYHPSRGVRGMGRVALDLFSSQTRHAAAGAAACGRDELSGRLLRGSRLHSFRFRRSATSPSPLRTFLQAGFCIRVRGRQRLRAPRRLRSGAARGTTAFIASSEVRDANSSEAEASHAPSHAQCLGTDAPAWPCRCRAGRAPRHVHPGVAYRQFAMPLASSARR